MGIATAGNMASMTAHYSRRCAAIRINIECRKPGRRPSQQRSELADALAACRGAFISIALMSGMSNILMLTGAVFMLEVYDRVLPSRSVPTLVGLVILAAAFMRRKACSI